MTCPAPNSAGIDEVPPDEISRRSLAATSSLFVHGKVSDGERASVFPMEHVLLTWVEQYVGTMDAFCVVYAYC